MNIKNVEAQGVMIITPEGRMDATTVKIFEEACQAQLALGHRKIVIDLSELEFVSSAGLRGILTIVKSNKSLAGQLVFCALQPMVQEVFRVSGFNSILSITASLDDAINKMQ